MNANPMQEDPFSLLNARLTEPVSILFSSTRHSATPVLKAFLEGFQEKVPLVRITTEARDEDGPPALHLGKTLKYHAAPSGGELEPFFEAIGSLPAPERMETADRLLEQVKWPAQIKIYVSPHCPFCPNVLRRIQSFANACPLIRVTVIDGGLFQEMAKADNVRSVPTTILDDTFRWTGVIPPGEIEKALLDRDPSQLGAKTLEAFIKDGNAGRLALIMLHQGKIFPAFVDLLLHPEWSVRLGALVAAEEMGEHSPRLARELLPVVWDRMANTADSVKGDMIYLIGVLGSPGWVPRLRELLGELRQADLREIAEEAIEKLETAPE